MTETLETSSYLEELEHAIVALNRGPIMLRLHELLNRRAGVDLDRTSYVALASLWAQGALRVSDLSEACGVDISTMSRVANRLVNEGLLDTHASSRDRRVLLVELSAAGRSLVGELLEVRRQALDELLTDWSRRDRDALARLLSRFMDGVERFVGEGQTL